ncbi:MAG: hypothetical protein V5A57_02530 [Candidatus Paceibacterota bacterium]
MRKLIPLLILLIVVGMFAPLFTSTLEADSNTESNTIGPKGGLVPCGRVEDDDSTENIDETVPCHLCHLFLMFERIVDFTLAYIVPPIAALMILIGGFLFMFGGASEEQITQARKIFTTVAIGIALIYGSYIIVSTFMTAVGVADWTGLDSWYELKLDDCPMSPEEVDRDSENGSSNGSENGNGNGNLSVSCTASPDPADTGNPITFSSSPSGGSGSYSYQWSGDCTGTSKNCNKTFSSEGTYGATVQVTSDGNSVSNSCSVEIHEKDTCEDLNYGNCFSSSDCCVYVCRHPDHPGAPIGSPNYEQICLAKESGGCQEVDAQDVEEVDDSWNCSEGEDSSDNTGDECDNQDDCWDFLENETSVDSECLDSVHCDNGECSGTAKNSIPTDPDSRVACDPDSNDAQSDDYDAACYFCNNQGGCVPVEGESCGNECSQCNSSGECNLDCNLESCQGTQAYCNNCSPCGNGTIEDYCGEVCDKAENKGCEDGKVCSDDCTECVDKKFVCHEYDANTHVLYYENHPYAISSCASYRENNIAGDGSDEKLGDVWKEACQEDPCEIDCKVYNDNCITK